MKPGSKAWKQFMAKLYGIGAAIVIVGALFKIMHWPFAGPMLVIGLGTEAFIFFFSAFEPIHEDPNWELVYPELALGNSDELDHEALSSRKSNSISDQLDTLLEEAKIDSALIGRLGDGMRSLGENAAQIKDAASAANATDNYVNSLQSASDKVSSLSEAYERASVSISDMSTAHAEGGEHMQKVSKNLSALNNVYELQLKGSSSHLEATEKFQSQVTSMMQNLSESVEDTRMYKENMSMLSKNLTDLNAVYGNMLKAMTINK
ncbi:MAG: gliding motility protein GldL [Crocinitomicaceae bacterium]|nr:gliding motility protein GldL [Crocinitomicaceae bacterium]